MKWALLCHKCHRKTVHADMHTVKEFRRMEFRGYGRKDELDAMSADERSEREPIVYDEPVWIITGPTPICDECKGGRRKGPSV